MTTIPHIPGAALSLSIIGGIGAPEDGGPVGGPAFATLRFDSRAALAFAGFRGSASSDRPVSHLSYTCEHGEVDIQIQPGPRGARVRIIGQVESHLPARHVFLRQKQRAICEAAVAHNGMFELEAPPGSYELDIILNRGMIRIPAVDLT